MILPYKRGTVRVTSPYGMRTLNGVPEMHKGIDLVGSFTSLIAPCGGRIGWAGMVDDAATGGRTHEWGNYVRIDTDTGYSVYLCHLASYCVRIGQTVLQGDLIGVEGNTGNVWPKPASPADKTTGRHLHFEVRKDGKSTDPTLYLGIDNRAGTYPVTELAKNDANAGKNAENAENNTDFAALVCERCGFEPQTREYLDNYRFSTDLWRKLWEAMSK